MRAYNLADTIVALATPNGIGAIGVIRLSGTLTFAICDAVIPGKKISSQPSHTIHFGRIKDGEMVLDEVLVSVFKGPNSYTGEDVAEISCHGSPFIQQKILELLVRKGARLAGPGEFTLRAFLNRKLDLSQAEAVADLIASDSEASLKTAMNQMRGGFSAEIRHLREKLLHFASLIELELDFGEEDVEFANRGQLRELILEIQRVIAALLISFRYGNVVKNGIATVIAGKPNAGKSTLLNVLLNEERAIVSEIAGTTRDTIEEAIQLNGITFRFIDTAGIRSDADSSVEQIGIRKAFEKIQAAALVIYLFDVHATSPAELAAELEKFADLEAQLLLVGNKTDLFAGSAAEKFADFPDAIYISSGTREISALQHSLTALAESNLLQSDQTLITNVRHVEALQKTQEALDASLHALEYGISGDFMAQDIRRALYHLGEISGEITTDDLLGNIFSKFCIGK